MKEELVRICKDLKQWCEKYGEEYVSCSVVNNNAFANVSIDSDNYKELNIFIHTEEDAE